MTIFTTAEKALVIIPKWSGGLSFLSSLFIVQDILRCPKRRSTSYHRLILGLSISDMFGSFSGSFLSSWPIPASTDPPIYGAVGTTATCTAAGFFSQAGNVGTPLYNGSLATYYYLMIVLGWEKSKIFQSEWMLHVLPIAFSWGTAFAGIGLKLYNSANFTCWIAPYPSDCKDSHTYGPEEANCERGDNAWIYRLAFASAEVWAVFAYQIFAMMKVYWTILKQERANDRYNVDGVNRRQSSKKVANQALLYTGSFLITWIFEFLTRLLQAVTGKTFFPLLILFVIFWPLQGFLNFLIYIRPRFLRWWKENPEFLSIGPAFSTKSSLWSINWRSSDIRFKSRRSTELGDEGARHQGGGGLHVASKTEAGRDFAVDEGEE